MSLFIHGFVWGWGACTLFFTAIFAFKPHWIMGRRGEGE